MNQFDRLGDISYLTINETDKSFKEFMESTLGFPIPIKYVGDNAGRVAGWPPDPADDYVDRSFAVKVVIQDVVPFVETVIAQRITDQERLISLLDIPDEPGHFPDDKECFWSVIEHLTSVDVLTKMRSRCRFQYNCRWIEERIEELQSPEDIV